MISHVISSVIFKPIAINNEDKNGKVHYSTTVPTLSPLTAAKIFSGLNPFTTINFTRSATTQFAGSGKIISGILP